jgi:hypothetical protein
MRICDLQLAKPLQPFAEGPTEADFSGSLRSPVDINQPARRAVAPARAPNSRAAAPPRRDEFRRRVERGYPLG